MRRFPWFVSMLALAPAAVAQATWYVDDTAIGLGTGASWTDAFPLLQDAIAVAQSGDSLWVAEGRYTPDQGGGLTPGQQKSAFYVSNGVRFYGGFAGTETSLAARAGLFDTTILDGDLLGDDATGALSDNSFRVVMAANTGPTTVLDGFTIRGGRATLTGLDGGGLYGQNVGLRIENCTFRDNYAAGDGGAMAALFGLAPKLARCTFIDNEAGGNGGAVWFSAGLGPSGSSAEAPLFYSCRFLGNVSGGLGGAAYQENAPAGLVAGFCNCLFSGNTAGNQGGGLYTTASPGFRVVGCTFVGNVAANAGGGLASSAAPLVAGCVFWGNTGSGQMDLSGQLVPTSGSYVSYSCVQGLQPSLTGAGNTGADPLLIDPDGPDDLAGTLDDLPWLSAGSPVIDAGNGLMLAPDLPDLDGDGDTTEVVPLDLFEHDRSADDLGTVDTGIATPGAGVPDMGAAEYHVSHPLEGVPGSVSIQNGGGQSLLLSAGPSLAGKLYLLLGTETGDSPGLPVDQVVLPLNPGPYLFHTIGNPNQPPLTGSMANLDANGNAQASFTLPAQVLNPIFVGAALHHAYLVVDIIGGSPQVVFASNAWPVVLAP